MGFVVEGWMTLEHLEEKIRPLVESAAQTLGLEVVRIRMMGGNHRPTLQIMAEYPDGKMDIGSCEKLSRELSVLLDIYEGLVDAYVLEVSSPGIDRPLMRYKDYVRWCGFEASLETHERVNNRKRFRGRLEKAFEENGEEKISILQDGVSVTIPYGLIRKGRLVLTDDLIEATGAGKALHDLTADDVVYEETAQ
jgi:ribosome maturation factor RimP